MTELFFFYFSTIIMCKYVEVSNTCLSLGSCDRASWVKYEESKTNKMQQLYVYY